MHLLLVLRDICSALFLVVPMNDNGLMCPGRPGFVSRDRGWKLKISCQVLCVFWRGGGMGMV